MITLSAVINLIPEAKNLRVSYGNNRFERNNISSALESVVGGKKTIQNPFIIGDSKLGEGDTFADSVDYYIGNELSGDTTDSYEEYSFESNYSFSIVSDTEFSAFTIVFDTAKNRHPSMLKIDSQLYAVESPTFFIENLEPKTSHSIEILGWNTRNAPLVISGIYVKIDIEMNKRNLISLNAPNEGRPDILLPSYGIISNQGSVSFVDKTGEIYDYYDTDKLKDNQKVNVYLNNTARKISTPVGVYYTSKWKYDTDSRTVDVQLKDNLEEWQNINVEQISYDPLSPNSVLHNQTLADFYNWLRTRTPSKFNVVPFSELSAETQNILTNTFWKYPTLSAGTLWSAWNKLCEASGCYICKDRNDNTIMRYDGGK